ncbi:MAG: Response regulator rcp1 [Legionellaceae bacterium]
MKEKIILLVEDNPYDEALTREAFKINQFEHKIIHAKDGEEALNILLLNPESHGINYEKNDLIILLDLKLPKINGIEVLKEIRAHKLTQCLPVIILTSSKEEKDVLNSYLYTANSYLRKPVDFAEFVTVVKALGDYWLKYNESPPVFLSSEDK